MNRGDCFLNIETRYDRPHCWVILSDPSQSSDIVAIVNLTKWTSSRIDDSCLIEPGEHPFVTHETCINYREAKKSSVSFIENGVQQSVLTPLDPMSEPLLRRITMGAQNSRFSPGWLISILDEQGLL